MVKEINRNILSVLVTLLFALVPLCGWSQATELASPKWAQKAMKSLVSVLAYDKNNELMRSGTGVYVSSTGEVVADYSLLRDAWSAAVVDAGGQRHAVERVLGADDTYGMVRMKVDVKKSAAVPMASTASSVAGTQVFALHYGSQVPKTMPSTSIVKRDLVDEQYGYYTLEDALDVSYTGAALFNARGEWVGLVLSPVAGRSFAMDGRYGLSLDIKAIQTKAGSLALNNIHMKKGLPSTVEEALVYLYFKSRSAGNDEYMDLLNLFVTTWPDNAEGYYRRATTLTDLHRFDDADADLQKYLRLAVDAVDANARVASSIYTKLVYQPEPAYDRWTWDVALGYVDKALEGARQRLAQAANDSLRAVADASLLQYQLQKAQILMGKKDDKAALAIYDDINSGPHRSPATLYAASLAHEAAGDSLDVQVKLMDDAIGMFPIPMPADAANYVMRRGQLKAQMGKWREAVLDYNQYCYLQNNQVSTQFYYDRSQLEVSARMFQQALDDITKAAEMEPGKPLYSVERCAVLLRVGMMDECVAEAKRCLQLDNQNTDALRMMGYAQVQQGKKSEGRANLQRAADMGDDIAKNLLENMGK